MSAPNTGTYNTLVAGNTEQHPTAVKLLMMSTFLLGSCLTALVILFYRIGDTNKAINDLGKEVRILQINVEDQSAVMIREGVMKPDDKKLGPILGGIK